MVQPKAVDSLNLPSNKDLKVMKDLCKSIGEVNDSYVSITSMEEQFKQKKGVSWYDRDANNSAEGETKPGSLTYVVEDPRYTNALKVVTKALESLLNVKISLANVDHMENVVKIIISLCIDFSIKTENIHENMLAMGTYIRDFQKTKEKLEETMKDNVRLEKEIAHLNNQIDSTRRLYKSYKEVKGSELREKMVELEDEKKKLRERADAFELDYSKAFGRKTDYKDMKKEVEREFTQYKKKNRSYYKDM